MGKKIKPSITIPSIEQLNITAQSRVIFTFGYSCEMILTYEDAAIMLELLTRSEIIKDEVITTDPSAFNHRITLLPYQEYLNMKASGIAGKDVKVPIWGKN